MSASHGTASHSDDHAHETHAHPPMPAIHYEASDTPTWLPITGVALFVLVLGINLLGDGLRDLFGTRTQ